MSNHEVFMFPGQASQWVGMGRKLEQSKAAQEVFEEADAALRDFSWWNKMQVQDLCLNGPEDKLNNTLYAQPAIFTVEMAALEDLKRSNRHPAAVTGHSVGEYGGFVAVGSMSFGDAINVVAQRGKFMQDAAKIRPGAMIAIIGLPVSEVEILCKRLQVETSGSSVKAANINSPKHIIISGDLAALIHAEEYAEEAGATKVIRLPVTIAGHSELMRPAAADMKHVLDSITIIDPQVPFYSPTTGGRVYTSGDIRILLLGQLTSNVLWPDTIRQMIIDGYRTFLEVGSKKALTRFVREIDESVEVSATNS